jgi:RHS repeat-associated protein
MLSPFGISFADRPVTEKGLQPYKYNGKELDQMHGLNTYDYHARQQDFQTGRFTSVDPLAEKYYSWSPYHLAGNNPILNIDPFGMDYWSTNDPAEIERFYNNIQSGWGISSYDYGSWDHATDAEFTSNLTYNDETGIFYSSYNTIEDNIVTSNGIKIKAYDTDGNNKTAKIYHDFNQKSKFETSIIPELNGWEHTIGPSLYLPVEGFIPKKSKLAKAIFPRSSIVGHAGRNTSLVSLITHRFRPSAAMGVKATGRVLGPIGYVITAYDATTLGWELGKKYGPVTHIYTKAYFEYLEYQENKKQYKPVLINY